jgi:hypothetical protein
MIILVNMIPDRYLLITLPSISLSEVFRVKARGGDLTAAFDQILHQGRLFRVKARTFLPHLCDRTFPTAAARGVFRVKARTFQRLRCTRLCLSAPQGGFPCQSTSFSAAPVQPGFAYRHRNRVFRVKARMLNEFSVSKHESNPFGFGCDAAIKYQPIPLSRHVQAFSLHCMFARRRDHTASVVKCF